MTTKANTAVVETANLEGLALHWAVAKALGLNVLVHTVADQIGRVDRSKFTEYEIERLWGIFVPKVRIVAPQGWDSPCDAYSTDWNVAGVLVDDHIKRMGDCGEPVAGWDAIPEGKQYFAMAHNNEFATGSTKRIAVCRAVVLAKLGTSVEVPAVLVSQ